MIKAGRLPNNLSLLPETRSTTINNANIKVRPHSSLISELHLISSRDGTSRLLPLPLEPNIQSPDLSNRRICPLGRMAPANLPCRMSNPHLIPMVSQVLLRVHGFRIPVYITLRRLADLLHGYLLLDRLNFIIPINRSDVGYLVELLRPYQSE